MLVKLAPSMFSPPRSFRGRSDRSGYSDYNSESGWDEEKVSGGLPQGQEHPKSIPGTSPDTVSGKKGCAPTVL